MWPNLHAVFFALEPEPRPKEELNTQSQGGTPLVHERALPSISGELSLGTERAGSHEKNVPLEPRTRSCRIPRKEKNRKDIQIWKKGEDLWLLVEGKPGSFPMSIFSEGTWDCKEDQWKYQLQQTDGKLYENGKLVGEHDFSRTPKKALGNSDAATSMLGFSRVNYYTALLTQVRPQGIIASQPQPFLRKEIRKYWALGELHEMHETNSIDLMEKGVVRNVGSSPSSPTSTIITAPSIHNDGKSQNDTSSSFHSRPLFRQLQDSFLGFRIGLGSPRQPTMEPKRSVVRVLEHCPEGYPRLAALLDSDENFMLYRRFGFLQARLLLNKQDELRELEKDLDRLDKVDEAKDPSLLKSREKDDAASGHRKELLRDIEKRFKEYVQLLTAARDITSLNRPSARDYLSVKSYFDEETPLCNVESYIYRKEDIITLKPGRETAWLDAFIEKVLQKLSSRFIRYLFCSPEQYRKTDPAVTGIILYSRRRINVVASLVITAMVLALLIVPVYVLWHLTPAIQSGTDTAVIIGILLIFTLIFSGTLSLLTRARRHEVLASAAAYCAVLVVFFGNVGQFSPTKNT